MTLVNKPQRCFLFEAKNRGAAPSKRHRAGHKNEKRMAEVCRLLARDHIKIRSPSQDQVPSHHESGGKSEKEKNSLCQRFFKPCSEHIGQNIISVGEKTTKYAVFLGRVKYVFLQITEAFSLQLEKWVYLQSFYESQTCLILFGLFAVSIQIQVFDQIYICVLPSDKKTI